MDDDEDANEDLTWQDCVAMFQNIGHVERLADEDFQRQELLATIVAAIDPNAKLFEVGKAGVWSYSGIELRHLDEDGLVLAFHEELAGERIQQPGWCERIEKLLNETFGERIRVRVEP